MSINEKQLDPKTLANLQKNQPKSVSVLRLSDHGENKRIWIVSKKLQSVFQAGDKVIAKSYKNEKMMVIDKAEILGGTHTISKRKSGTPILDIKNKSVEETFGSDVEKIEVLFFEDQIVIKVSKTEKFKSQRADKNGLNTFELFCGGGTLSQFFKEAGFNIIGGLELNPDYLALFHENHEGDEIYSISGNLEDIHTSYFPRNVDRVLAGIPCTKYSGSNLKLKQAQKAKREGKDYDEAEIAKEYEAEALTFYVLTAIRAMNPKTVVVEEVVEYSESSASMMLRTILGQMGYELSETVIESTHTKRVRWCLVANMGAQINLDNLSKDDGKTIVDFLETSIEDREWQSEQENPRVAGMIKKGLGIRSCLPTDKKSNTFTTHRTRHTEPILKHPTQELYSEFTDKEIANIHGLSNYHIGEVKTLARQVLGQGVTDVFREVANRIKQKSLKKEYGKFEVILDTTSSRYLVSKKEKLVFSAELDITTNEVLIEGCKDSYELYSDIDPTGSACFMKPKLTFNEKSYHLIDGKKFSLGKEIK